MTALTGPFFSSNVKAKHEHCFSSKVVLNILVGGLGWQTQPLLIEAKCEPVCALGVTMLSQPEHRNQSELSLNHSLAID